MADKKRKISIRKVLQLLLTLVVTSCCVIAISSASKIEGEKVLKTIAIHYNNCKKYHSVEEQEIMDLVINSKRIDIQHTPISKLDVHAMEKTIMANPWMANAQVFVDNERVLHMYVTQRIPVVRIFQENGASYYMDTTTSIIPLSANYIYYSTVVTNVPEIKNDSIGRVLRNDIISLVKNIRSDSFWSAQISHVIVDSVGAYELVPILGDHRILFGDAHNIKEKLNNLFAFYRNVLNRIGWDKYQVLDIRFENQVVASPSLPYSGPVDKAANTINWVNSIIETEAKSDSLQKGEKTNISTGKVTMSTTPAKEIGKYTKTVQPDKKIARSPVENGGKGEKSSKDGVKSAKTEINKIVTAGPPLKKDPKKINTKTNKEPMKKAVKDDKNKNANKH